MFEKTISRIKKALKSFGVPKKSTETMTAYQIGDIVRVNISGEYFGLWDVCKNTFVD